MSGNEDTSVGSTRESERIWKRFLPTTTIRCRIGKSPVVDCLRYGSGRDSHELDQHCLRNSYTPVEDLSDHSKRDLLRAAFTDPERLRPLKTVDALTLEAANRFAAPAIRLRERGHDPERVAHFVNRLVFCMFAEDIDLLPRKIFNQILEKSTRRPELAQSMLGQLFEAMKGGGLFGVDEIPWFNGGLFDNSASLP